MRTTALPEIVTSPDTHAVLFVLAVAALSYAVGRLHGVVNYRMGCNQSYRDLVAILAPILHGQARAPERPRTGPDTPPITDWPNRGPRHTQVDHTRVMPAAPAYRPGVAQAPRR